MCDDAPVFPSLMPSAVDPLWFSFNTSCDEENELSKLEKDFQKWKQSMSEMHQNIIPIGKSTTDHVEEEDDEEDEEADDEEESDTNDEEIDTDMIDERDSHDDVEMEVNGALESPTY